MLSRQEIVLDEDQACRFWEVGQIGSQRLQASPVARTPSVFSPQARQEAPDDDQPAIGEKRHSVAGFLDLAHCCRLTVQVRDVERCQSGVAHLGHHAGQCLGTCQFVRTVEDVEHRHLVSMR